MAKKPTKATPAPAETSAVKNPPANQSMAVLVSLLYIINKANSLVTSKYPGANCVQAAGEGPLAAIPNSYKITFRAADGVNTLVVIGTEDTKTGAVTFSDITEGGPILGVGGNITEATIDIYPATKAIARAGYTNPIFFCGLFQAVVPHIDQPWYCFTPNNCSSPDSSNYIFVNSITGEVRLFPTDAQYKA